MSPRFRDARDASEERRLHNGHNTLFRHMSGWGAPLGSLGKPHSGGAVRATRSRLPPSARPRLPPSRSGRPAPGSHRRAPGGPPPRCDPSLSGQPGTRRRA
ncbi:hypothetical protein CRV15_26510 [Streptomyces clavuligerus]|uniref:Uncharacterized protein n=1 Tax=Streptomyces clavuligerus TaxID=1901 RepID=B5H093_STRCL|nr:hypothetical protein D1794_27145 [Streptomyces clavuligerus]EDY51989.1 hypothetical protein SSCG_05054 [Streptomyces clavuligerus]EFG05408.1 Hypothetical protein SCLAV_0332 [Streptomyces clavuligerus]QCS08849.1 hypothetical protein CRV15_26510 [Streptomyces clavuligerus]QPJ91811.1 hypothetical protein GE265_01625 [Streptomyces clavuligerus]